jgi:CheY-like chemotaxis protein
MHAWLEALGCEVHAARSGREALDLVHAGTPIDLALVDLRLQGGETGLEVIRALRAVAGRTLPAVIITGDTAPEGLRAVSALGVPLLHKPVRTSRLVELLGGLLRQAPGQVA